MALDSLCIIDFSWTSRLTSDSDLAATNLTKEDEEQEVKPEERSFTRSSRSDDVIGVIGATDLL
ncbi:hypothetical protein Hanom_Chr01g00065741 [Helianthus anomalus]